jgi:hypothetical protein
MTRAEACLAKAAECERAAVLASDPKVRNMYSDLATQWRELVSQADALEQRQRAR